MPGKAAAFVVIAGGSQLDLDECLLSLGESTCPPGQTIVVDNSPAGLCDHISVSFPNVAVVQPRTRLTFAQAANLGTRMAIARGARLVFLLNDDVTVHPRALEILSTAESQNGPGIYAPEIWPYETSHSRTRFALDWKKHLVVRVPVAVNGPLSTIDYAEGSGVLFSVEVVHMIGLFDEAFGFYYEDADFSLRAARAGFPVCEVEGARVWHKGSVSAGAGLSPFKAYYRARNTLRFAWKHRNRAHLVSIAAYHFATFLVPSLVWAASRAVVGSRIGAQIAAALARGTWDLFTGTGKPYLPRVVPPSN